MSFCYSYVEFNSTNIFFQSNSQFQWFELIEIGLNVSVGMEAKMQKNDIFVHEILSMM